MTTSFDAIIIGSGFGGAFAASVLVEAGWSVLLIERGRWVARGPEASRIDNFVLLSPYYSNQAAYRVRNGARKSRPAGALFCVGGASVFYGGVSFRFRESDFRPQPEIVGESAAEWPIGYRDLEPYYTEAERLLGVSGNDADDPVGPDRSAPYPNEANPFSPLSSHLATSARALGLHPFPLPMAINFRPGAQAACVRCGTCDGWACPVSAKNDVATRLLQPLIGRGLTLLADTAVVRLIADRGRVTEVECVELGTGRRFSVQGREVLLAAGALATPQLLLASGLERHNPGGAVVGRYLTRHANAIVFGRLRRAFPPDGLGKDLAVLDFYQGDPHSPDAPPGPLGSLQSMPVPSVGVIATQVPWPIPWLAGVLLRRSAGLLAITHDQPNVRNGVAIDSSRSDPAGLPGLTIEHHYSRRDAAALGALCRRARAILRKAGAVFFYQHPIRTFSHAMGTVRMGADPGTSALDEHCRFRGIENLRIVDASAFPTPGGVNPSLTIAANSLRATSLLAGVARRAA